MHQYAFLVAAFFAFSALNATKSFFPSTTSNTNLNLLLISTAITAVMLQVYAKPDSSSTGTAAYFKSGAS